MFSSTQKVTFTSQNLIIESFSIYHSDSRAFWKFFSRIGLRSDPKHLRRTSRWRLTESEATSGCTLTPTENRTIRKKTFWISNQVYYFVPLWFDRDFWDWKVVSRRNRDFSISIVETNFLKVSRFLDCRDQLSASVEIESLDRDKSRPPGLIFYQFFEKWVRLLYFRIDQLLVAWRSNDKRPILFEKTVNR